MKIKLECPYCGIFSEIDMSKDKSPYKCSCDLYVDWRRLFEVELEITNSGEHVATRHQYLSDRKIYQFLDEIKAEELMSVPQYRENGKNKPLEPIYGPVTDNVIELLRMEMDKYVRRQYPQLIIKKEENK